MQSVPLARRSVLCCRLGDSMRRWTQLPALRPVKMEYVPDKYSDRQSQVWWERNSCSIQDYTLQSNSRRLPSIIYKGNRCTLNMKENALKMFWPKSYLLIRKEGKLPKAYGNSTFQLIHKYRFPSHWIYVKNIYFIYLRKNYYSVFYLLLS